eukprot:1157661-Pelagomonas_calceolata.AAC.10
MYANKLVTAGRAIENKNTPHSLRGGGGRLGFMPRLIRHGLPNWQVLNLSATERGNQVSNLPVGENLCREHPKNT